MRVNVSGSYTTRVICLAVAFLCISLFQLPFGETGVASGHRFYNWLISGMFGAAPVYAAPPKVICVPHVPSDMLIPHETWAGEPTILKGVARGVATGTYYWEFGDGNSSQVMSITDSDNLAIIHQYDASPGTLFIAHLHVINEAGEEGVDDYRVLVKEKTLDVEVNKAIDDGLWWLYTRKDEFTLIPMTAFKTATGLPGLLGQYFNNFDLSGDPVLERIDPAVNFVWGGSPGEGVNTDFSARWTGTIIIPEDGVYGFASYNDDGTRLYIDGELIIDDWRGHPPTWRYSRKLWLSAGEHSFRLDFYDSCCGAQAQIYWTAMTTVRWGNANPDNRYNDYYGNTTASAVQAFEINGHLETGDPDEDPYASVVRGGIAFLLNGLASYDLNLQHDDNPDSNGNGIGLGWPGNRPIYELGAIMDALVASGTPDAIAQFGGVNVLGRRYQDIVQDMVDMYAWGQVDSGSRTGGWRYAWNSDADNSASQWAAIGIVAAERHFGCSVPEWVRDYNRTWLDTSYNSAGFFGYTDRNAYRSGFATGPSGMVQMAFDNIHVADARWRACEQYLESNWSDFLGWDRAGGHQTRDGRYYSYYAFAKAMRLALPREVEYLPGGINWYGDEVYGLARLLVDTQNPDGSWPYDGWPYVGPNTAGAWNVIILTRTLFEKPPVAVIHAEPNPGAVGQIITFDGSASYHTDPAKQIVQYLWDFDASDGVDFEHPDATGVTASHTYGNLQDYTVSLKVIDNSTPERFDVSNITLHITVPPHPPTAVIGGPYIAAAGEGVHVDGGGSYDIDEAEGDSITAWDWESDMVPPYGFDEAHGRQAVLPPFDRPGHYDIILRVSDNTATVFPLSGQPDLTDTDFGKVTVYETGVIDLNARPKDTKCQLTWTPTSAQAYRILRSDQGPNEGFVQIGTTTSGYAVFVDHNLAPEPGEPVNACRGDFNNDYVVDSIDAAIFANELGAGNCSETAPCLGDFDSDGDVDGTDNAFFQAEIGRAQCLQVTGVEMDKEYWYRIMTEEDGVQKLSAPAYVKSQGKIKNFPPVITSEPTVNATESRTYEYHVQAYDPEGTTVVFQLDIAPDGMQIDASTGLVTWVPGNDQVGVQDVMVRVTDEAGIAATHFFKIMVMPRFNSAPVADPGGPYSALTGETVSFSASATDPEGDAIVSLHWAFGDGTEAEGQQVTHVYGAAGTYTVSLFVTDDRGATGHAETLCQIEVPNRPPLADAGGPYLGFVGTPVEFDGSNSYDPDDDPMTFTWNFGDSSPAQGGIQVSHTYLQAGSYTATLSVDDGRGGLDSAQVDVLIYPPNQAPDASFSVYGDFFRWTTLVFDASTSSDPDGHDIVSYEWDFGDGLHTTGTIVSHAYAESGNYTVTLTVTDSFGMRGNATRQVVIVHPPNNVPVIDAGGPYRGAVGESITLMAEGADPDGDNITWSWSCNGNTYSGKNVQLVFDSPGTYSATVYARDGLGGNSSDTATIDIFDPNAPGDDVPPEVEILSPEPGAMLSGTVRFYGSVSDENLVSWRLEYAPSGSEEWSEVADGTSGVDNGLLAEVDVSSWPSDSYRFRLTATDGRQSATHWNDYTIINPLQLGRFSVSYNDLTLPVMGMKLRLMRTYRSTRSAAGDFGRGWTLDMKNVDLRESPNHNVFITLPDGRRTAFAFTPVRVSPWFPLYRAEFTAPPGVFDELDFVGNHDIVYSGGDWYYFMDPSGVFSPSTYILRTRDGLVYTIDEDFGVRRVEDRNGNWIIIDSSGITTSSGRNVAFFYNAQGFLSAITDPSGGTIAYEYDTAGHLVSFRDQAGNETRYIYNERGEMTEIIAPEGGRPMTVEYYDDGRVKARIDENGNRISYTYDVENRKETIIRPNGYYITYTYDENGYEVRRDNSFTGITLSKRDADGNLLEEVTPEGRRSVFTYDQRANKLTETRYVDPDDNSTARTRSFAYDQFGNPLLAVMEDGSRTEMTYDDNFNLIRRIRKDSDGNVLSDESWTYDERGNRLSYTDPLGNTTRYSYNGFGDMISKTDASGVTVSYEYDAMGRRTAIINALGQRTEITYDALGNLASVARNGVTAFSITGNHDGRPLSFTHERGTAHFYWTAMGRLSSVIDEAGSMLTPGYDEVLNMTSLRFEDSNGVNASETMYGYDLVGRVTSRTDPLGNIRRFSYDNDDYFTGEALPEGSIRIYARDGMGRTVQESSSEGTITYSYDLGNRLVKAVRVISAGRTDTVNISYTPAGLIKSVTDAEGRTVSYQYDAAGRRTGMIAPDGTTVIYRHDPAGRLTRVECSGAWISFEYDAAGRRVRQETSGGAVTEYTYNSAGLLDTLTIYDSSRAVAASYQYTYDSLGNRTQVMLNDGFIRWEYDESNRLTSETISSTALGTATRTFSYDYAGNRFSAGGSEVYRADNSLASNGTISFSYDRNGNMVSYTGGYSYSYNDRGRLTGYSHGVTEARYEYDFLGRRVSKNAGGHLFEYVYDNENVVAQYRDGALLALFIHSPSPDEPLMTIQGGEVWFYHHDARGNITLITNSAGEVVQRYGYDAWGKIVLNSGPFSFDGETGLVNTFTYTGREYDAESGLYHYRTRAYSPDLGRFLQRDGLQGKLLAPQSLNLYAYCRDNPVNCIDPSGQQVVVSYTLSMSVPSGREVAAALAGFLQGYSITNMRFLANYMDLIGQGDAKGLWWLIAYNKTKGHMEGTKALLGVSNKMAERIPLADVAAIPGAFKGGVTFMVGFSISIEAELDNITGEYTKEYTKKVEGGGFDNGVDQALDFIWRCRPY